MGWGVEDASEDYRLSMGTLGHKVRECESENSQCNDFDCQLDRTWNRLEDKPCVCEGASRLG